MAGVIHSPDFDSVQGSGNIELFPRTGIWNYLSGRVKFSKERLLFEPQKYKSSV